MYSRATGRTIRARWDQLAAASDSTGERGEGGIDGRTLWGKEGALQAWSEVMRGCFIYESNIQDLCMLHGRVLVVVRDGEGERVSRWNV